MKVVFLCKRFSTGKDSLEQRFGRLFHLPAGLSELGWEVRVFSLSYRQRPRSAGGRLSENLEWLDFPARPMGLLSYARAILALRECPPDVVYSSSDALQVVLGDWIARWLDVPHVVDLYDDYEAFGLTKVPGLTYALRRACRRAAGLTVVSQALQGIMAGRGVDISRVRHLPNGVPVRRPRLEKALLRDRLGLPRSSLLIGAVGALDDGRGIADLFDAFDRLKGIYPELHLVLVGQEAGSTINRRGSRIHRLGTLEHDDAMGVVSALDVAVVCNRPSAFANACHPMKLVEAVSMGTPVVAAAVGEVKRLLEARPDSLYLPGDSASLAERISDHLAHPRPLDPALALEWSEVSVIADKVLRLTASQGGR